MAKKRIVVQHLGNVQNLWRLCGEDMFLGFGQCPRCKEQAPDDKDVYCARYFVYATIREEPAHPPTVIEVDDG